MPTTTQSQIIALIDDHESTGEFLRSVGRAIRSLYEDEDLERCPDGFKHLIAAAKAFDEHEGVSTDEDDDDESDEDDDDESDD